MGLVELILKMIVFIVVAPLLGAVGAVWAPVVMAIALLATPLVCLSSLMFEEPYGVLKMFFEEMLDIACLPFVALQKLIKG